MTAARSSRAATGESASSCEPTSVSESTLIITSVFTLHDPLHQDELVNLLAGNAVDILEQTPGFLGSTLSRSDDHTAVVHHATWADDASLRAMLQSPAAQANVARTRRLATILLVRSHQHTRYQPVGR